MSYSKYGNRRIDTEYGRFDSQKEYRRFLELKDEEECGIISDLRRQVKYLLIPSQRKCDGTMERPVHYIADYVYEDHRGNLVVEDAKGLETPDYIIKRKLMLYIHGIEIVQS